MTAKARRWAIVLRAGDGTRLHSLTGRGGTPVSKQFCALERDPRRILLLGIAPDRVLSKNSVCA